MITTVVTSDAEKFDAFTQGLTDNRIAQHLKLLEYISKNYTDGNVTTISVVANGVSAKQHTRIWSNEAAARDYVSFCLETQPMHLTGNVVIT